MDFKNLIQNRYSVRNYRDKKVSREIIEEVLRAGQLAPSAANAQPWHFVVVDEQPLLGKIHEAYKRAWFQKVPAVIVAYGNHSASWKRSYDKKDHCDIDVAIAVDHMMLRAESLGVGTCWICHFDPQFLRGILPIEEGWETMSILALGYADSKKQPPKKRKELKDIVGYNEW